MGSEKQKNKEFSAGSLKKAVKFIMPFGMLSAVFFFIMDILGQTLWTDYNPITSYVSELTADGAPNATVLRILSNLNYVCLLIFTIGMSVISFIKYRRALQFGYSSLFIMALISIIGFDIFPMNIKDIFSLKNVFHILITSAIVCITIIAALFISYGYLKNERLKKLGSASLISSILFAVFNIALLILVLQQSDIIGFVQRLGVYTFYIYIFILSFVYTFQFEKSTLTHV